MLDDTIMPRTEEKKEFISQDGCHIDYRYFSAESFSEDVSSSVIILLHQESNLPYGASGFVKKLCLPGYRFLSLDMTRVAFNQDASAISNLTSHFQQFIEYVQIEYKIKEQDIAIISFNEQATALSSWIIDFAPNIRSVILYSPIFFFTSYDTLCSYLKRKTYSVLNLFFASRRRADEKEQTRKGKGGLSEFNIDPPGLLSWRNYKDILFASRRIARSAFSYPTSTQLVIMEKQRVGYVNSQLKFHANIGCNKKELIILPEAGPDNLGEDSTLFLQAKKFIADCFSMAPIVPSLFNSHHEGVTKDEYEKLRLPEANPIKSVYWKINQLALKHIGKLSNGIHLGLETGFDSGASLDYIYRNKPSGRNVLGKAIDNYYLSNIGWHCTRMRKKHVEALMLLAGQRLSEEHRSIRFLDIAAGHGSYIISAIKNMQYPIDHVLMRDFEQSNVLNGEKLIQDNKLEGLVTFEQGDAFSSQDLNTLPHDRTLTIVSGFYELFSDNRLVLASLNGIANATENGGYLIYTTKLWNPKLSYMARVLTSHKQGEHWLLRRRTQLEIDQLVNQAGFVKITQRIDPWGMFSVAMARKIAQ